MHLNRSGKSFVCSFGAVCLNAVHSQQPSNFASLSFQSNLIVLCSKMTDLTPVSSWYEVKWGRWMSSDYMKRDSWSSLRIDVRYEADQIRWKEQQVIRVSRRLGCDFQTNPTLSSNKIDFYTQGFNRNVEASVHTSVPASRIYDVIPNSKLKSLEVGCSRDVEVCES